MRSSQVLGDTDGLLVDALTHGWPKAAGRTQIDLAAKELFEQQLQAYQPEIARWARELNQQVHVAVRPRLVARHGAEQGQRLHEVIPAKRRFVRPQNAEHHIFFHGSASSTGPAAIVP